MRKRSELKARAKRALKSHYVLFVFICLIAAILGAENGNRNSRPTVSVVTTQDGTRTVATSPTMVGQMPGADETVFSQVLDALSAGDTEEGENLSQEAQEEAKESSGGVLGRTRGVLSMLVNSVTSGSILVVVFDAVISISGSLTLARGLLIVGAFLFIFLIWFFGGNVFRVIQSRMFMEGRVYEKVGVSKFLFLLHVKKWGRAAWTMLVRLVFQTLWSCTLVFGVVKRYSYFLVPYIVAENPDVGTLQAITLSRRMMKGHKWECFVLEISFFGWYLLDAVTFGLSSHLFTLPYRTATFTEYYVALRREAIEKKIADAELLNDRYLHEKAEDAVLQGAYADAAKRRSAAGAETGFGKGIFGLLSRWFGVIPFFSKREAAFEKEQSDRMLYERYCDALAGKEYPGRLSPIPESGRRKSVENVRYARNYSVPSLIMLFFSFSVIGWLWEVSLHLVTDGTFVNRGVLHGPWLPIYGTGGVLILVALKRFREKPLQEFLTAIVLCGCVEYFTAWYLETTHGGQKWWDYSGYFLNLHGRICAEGLLVFGLGGMAIVYVVAPLLDNLFRRISLKILIPVCVVLLAFYIADQRYSAVHPNTGEGITSYTMAEQEQEYAHAGTPDTLEMPAV